LTRRTFAAAEARLGKSVVFGLLELDGWGYTFLVHSLSADDLMGIIRRKTRKGAVYVTDSFLSCRSLKRCGTHYTIAQERFWQERQEISFARINGIEGFWSFANHGL